MRSPIVSRGVVNKSEGVVALCCATLGIAAYVAVFIGLPDRTRESVRPQIPQPSLVDAK